VSILVLRKSDVKSARGRGLRDIEGSIKTGNMFVNKTEMRLQVATFKGRLVTNGAHDRLMTVLMISETIVRETPTVSFPRKVGLRRCGESNHCLGFITVKFETDASEKFSISVKARL